MGLSFNLLINREGPAIGSLIPLEVSKLEGMTLDAADVDDDDID